MSVRQVIERKEEGRRLELPKPKVSLKKCPKCGSLKLSFKLCMRA